VLVARIVSIHGSVSGGETSCSGFVKGFHANYVLHAIPP